jgi:fimbrial chaperone protein
MLRLIPFALNAFVASAVPPGSALGQSIRVAPVTIEAAPQTSAASLTVTNETAKPVRMQVRIFAWRQRDGQDTLEKTSDAVVSPPQFQLGPNATNVVRIVRVADKPLQSQEAYRILLDEIPSREKAQPGAVAIVMRQSLPVFFGSGTVSASSLQWTASLKGQTLTLRAANTGDLRAKLTRLRVASPSGKVLTQVDGLAGYVLGKQARSWAFPLEDASTDMKSVMVEAMSDGGGVRASVPVRSQ